MTRVLIVDDKPENLYLLRTLLQGHGYDVDEARHGAEALVKARHAPPDLIISDLLMPVMDGYTLLRHWKADGRLKQIPFVVYTATYTEPQDERLALGLGADAFLVKPAEPESFMARIQEVIAKEQAGEFGDPHQPVAEEKALLEEYSETLIRKLEEKASQLEQANRALQEGLTATQKKEEALAERERLLSESQRIAHIGSWSWDLTGPITWTDETYRIYGVSPDTFTPTTESLVGLLHPEDRLAMQQWIEACGAGQSRDDLQFRAVLPNGTVRFLNGRGELMPGTENGLAHIAGTVQDITERKRAEDALRAHHEELENVYRTTPVGLGLIDRDLRFVRINERLAAINGKPVAAHLGRTIEEALPELAPALVPVYHRILDGGESVLDVEIHGTTPAEPGVMRDWLASYHPFHAADGSVSGVSIAVMEITRQVRAEEDLRRSETRFRDAFHVSPAGLTITRIADGKIAEVNDAFLRMFGFTREQVVGHTSVELEMLTPQQRSEIIRRQLETGGVRDLEIQARTRSGRMLVLLASSKQLDVGGEAFHITHVIDITERKQAEAALRVLSHRLMEVQDASRRELARELHDRVGQNLTALSLNLSIAQSVLPPASAQEIGHRLDDAVQLVAETMERMRDVMADLRPPMLDDYGLVAALRWYVGAFAQRTGLHVRVEGEELAPRLPVDVETALFRITEESLTNVARHAQARNVVVTLAAATGDTRLMISDDGAGFSPPVPGTCVSWGFTTMRERAEAVGARWRVESTPGRGTTVVVEVPKAGPASPALLGTVLS